MRQRIITGILFSLIVAVLIIPGMFINWFNLIFLALIAVFTASELLGALKNKGLRPSAFFVYAGVMTFLLPVLPLYFFNNPVYYSSLAPDLISLLAGLALFASVMLAVMFLNMILPLLSKGPELLSSSAAGSLTVAYIAFPLGCSVLLIFTVPDGWYWFAAALLAPWASDVFAYFTGSMFGRRHIVPMLSPKKTIEGTLGGIVGSMLIMVLFFEYILRPLSGYAGSLTIHLIFAMATGAVLSIASQLGDWLASAVKRWCRIKDFGRLLPGHGGIMDRFDSTFFTMPVTLLLAVIYWQIF